MKWNCSEVQNTLILEAIWLPVLLGRPSSSKKSESGSWIWCLEAANASW